VNHATITPNTELTPLRSIIRAVTGTALRARAARGHLARLVAVLAVLAGLGYAVGLQCTGGMTTDMVMAHGTTSTDTVVACQSPLATSNTVEHADTRQCPAPVFAVAADDSSSFDGLGGVLATCLAFLIAVVAAVATLRPGHLRGVGGMSRPVRMTVLRAGRPQPLTLAELCVLRT
jgi:hypothetical protein